MPMIAIRPTADQLFDGALVLMVLGSLTQVAGAAVLHWRFRGDKDRAGGSRLLVAAAALGIVLVGTSSFALLINLLGDVVLAGETLFVWILASVGGACAFAAAVGSVTLATIVVRGRRQTTDGGRQRARRLLVVLGLSSMASLGAALVLGVLT